MSSTNPIPYIIEPDELETLLANTQLGEDILIIDMCKADIYRQNHIPSAANLDYAQIVTANPPVMGLLPAQASLQSLFSNLGISPETHVIAYDEEGGGKASRLLWTLEIAGHKKMSLLNGGLHAWTNEGHALSSDSESKPFIKAEFQYVHNAEALADKNYILGHLNNEQTVLLDARSPDEFNGNKKFAQRAGHIPGAINLDWQLLMDQTRNFRLKENNQLSSMFDEMGISPEKEVIVYCHTHHRSALSYVALKSLGFEKVSGYPGSWSDWGNSSETPIES